MAPTSNIFAIALMLTTSIVSASPMPFPSVSSAQVWWTPEASRSEWDWKTWAETMAQSTPTVAAVQSTSVVQAASAVVSKATSPAYSNPFTIYTTMTNSMGVITGMPAVATSQPDQAPKATECSGCASVLSAESSWSSMVASIYSTTTPVAAAASTTPSAASHKSSDESSASATASSTGTEFSQSTGAASRRQVVSGGAAMCIFAAVAYLL